MIRLPIAVLFLAILAAPSLAQPPVAFNDAAIRAVQFIDQSEGWAVGDDGVIWHSIDGGKTWERQKSGTRASLRGVHFQTPYTGWAVGRVETTSGSVGVMLRTTDGGLHWDEVGTNVLPGLHAVRFFDDRSGFVCGDGSPAFASGMFTTADGGRTWKPVSGVRLPSCRAAAFIPGKRSGVVAGAWGRLGTLSQDGRYQESELDPLAGRTVHAVCTTTTHQSGLPTAFAAADGGVVLSSTDGGRSWGFVNLGLSPEALAACDFRCCAAFGSHVWVAGKPGGFVLHSADHGKTWGIQKTELSVPVNGLYFLSHEIGWMVGELGCILGTTDGGKTWRVQRAGGQRAAVLCLHASHRSTPLDVVSTLGYGEGYLCTAVGLMSADPVTSDPATTMHGARLCYGMRLAGGAAADVGWAFPVAAHAVGLPPRELLASWDRAHDGKAAEQLLRQAVLAIRIWQPEVIVAESVDESECAGAVLALHAAKEAFKQAADPQCFPEQLATLGLKPWSAKKVYAPTAGTKGVPVLMDQSIVQTALVDSPKNFVEPAERILGGSREDRRAFSLVAHRLEGAEKHTALMEGIVLARSGSARRPEGPPVVDPAAVEEMKRASDSRRQLEGIAKSKDPEFAGMEKILGILGTETKKLPDDVAARTVHTIATSLAADGRWTEAREVYGLLVTRYPGHPLALEGFRWLMRYHASSEARRRAEIQQKLLIQRVSFDAQPGARKVIATSGTSSQATSPSVQEDRYGFFNPEATLKWHQSCLDLEPKLIAFGPVYSRDPSAWLCLLSARRRLGRHNDAITFIRDYFKNSPDAVAMSPGADALRDCLAAELWMTDRNLVPAPPKPVCESKRTESRPLLDGKLDDACWRDAKPIRLILASGLSESGGESKGMEDRFRTDARFAYDGEFIYISVSCSHPAGLRAEPTAWRTRDSDLSGHDRVDILLDLDRDYQTYYRLQIDHRGCLAEDCWGDRSWNPKYFAAFHSTDTEWTAELAIPVQELTGDLPSHGKMWAMNVTRVVPGKGLLSWSGPADQTPRPEGMGLLQFRADR